MADRFYLVKLNTNMPERKLPQLDQTFTKEIHLQFGSTAQVYWVPLDQLPMGSLELLSNE